MEDIASVWAWLGAEFAGFGLRWLAVAVIMVGFGGWFGKRYRTLKARVAALEQQKSRTPSPVTIHMHTGSYVVADGGQIVDIDGRASVEAERRIKVLGMMTGSAGVPTGTVLGTVRDRDSDEP